MAVTSGEQLLQEALKRGGSLQAFVDNMAVLVTQLQSGKVPYVGATGNVNLGARQLKALTVQIGGASDNADFEDTGFLQLNGDAGGYVDIFFPHGLPKTTGVGNPALVTYLGNLRGYEYAVNDAHDFDPQEYYHQCVVGGPVSWHLHWNSRSNVAEDRTVKWEIERSVVSPSGVETIISPNAVIEVIIPANTPVNTMLLTSIVDDTIANIGPAWMLSARIKRITSSGTGPATNPIIKALHAHVKIDTPQGSRDILVK